MARSVRTWLFVSLILLLWAGVATADADDFEEDGEEEEGEATSAKSAIMEGCITSRALGGGWEEYFDNDQRRFYYHRAADGTTQWDFPYDACDAELHSYVRLSRLLLALNGLNICVRKSESIPVYSYQYRGVLIEPSSTWCWDPVELPGLCYVKFALMFNLDVRTDALLRRAASTSLRKRTLVYLGLSDAKSIAVDADGASSDMTRSVDDLFDLLLALQETFRGSNQTGLVYRNESYFSAKYRSKHRRSNGTVGWGSPLPNEPFNVGVCRPEFNTLLSIAEASLWWYAPWVQVEWKDTDFSGAVYRQVVLGNVEGLSKLLLKEKIGESDTQTLTFRSSDGRGALWWAYETNNMKVVELFVRSGAWSEERDAYGLKPHHLQKKSGATRSMYACARVEHGGDVCSHYQEDPVDRRIDAVSTEPFVLSNVAYDQGIQT